jgi:hypothetical protein
VAPGSAVTYTYTVTNNTSATLNNMTLVDDAATPNDPSGDVTIGSGFSLDPGESRSFTASLIPPIAECTTISGQTLSVSTLLTQLGTYNGSGSFKPTGSPTSTSDLRVIFNQSLSLVDNTYGTGHTSTRWSNGHKFSGSDGMELQIANKQGTAIMNFGGLDAHLAG